MTFGDFKAIVLENLGPDSARTGVGLGELRDRAIVNAMVDLQRFIPRLRSFNSITRQATDLAVDGRTSTGILPAEVRPQEWWICAVDTTLIPDRYRLEGFDWSKRQQLIDGMVPDASYFYSVAPDGYSFLIHPGLTSATYLKVFYNGLKTSFTTSDTLGLDWTPNVAEAVAEYAKARIVRHYDKDDLKRAQFHEAEYQRTRRGLFIDQKN